MRLLFLLRCCVFVFFVLLAISFSCFGWCSLWWLIMALDWCSAPQSACTTRTCHHGYIYIYINVEQVAVWHVERSSRTFVALFSLTTVASCGGHRECKNVAHSMNTGFWLMMNFNLLVIILIYFLVYNIWLFSLTEKPNRFTGVSYFRPAQ